ALQPTLDPDRAVHRHVAGDRHAGPDDRHWRTRTGVGHAQVAVGCEVVAVLSEHHLALLVLHCVRGERGITRGGTSGAGRHVAARALPARGSTVKYRPTWPVGRLAAPGEPDGRPLVIVPGGSTFPSPGET